MCTFNQKRDDFFLTNKEFIDALISELDVIKNISDLADAAYAAGDKDRAYYVCGLINRESGLDNRVRAGLINLRSKI